MLNNIAEFVCEFLAKGPWKNPDNNIVAGTGNLPQTYWFTKLATGLQPHDDVLRRHGHDHPHLVHHAEDLHRL